MFALLKLIPLRGWLYIAAAVSLVLGVSTAILHERHIGAEKCRQEVTKAQIEADKRVSELQARLDSQAAAHDKALRDAINAVPRATPKIPFDPRCRLTPEQIKGIREALK